MAVLVVGKVYNRGLQRLGERVLHGQPNILVPKALVNFIIMSKSLPWEQYQMASEEAPPWLQYREAKESLVGEAKAALDAKKQPSMMDTALGLGGDILKGVGDTITGIPGALAGIGSAAWEGMTAPVRAATGQGFPASKALVQGVANSIGNAGRAITTMGLNAARLSDPQGIGTAALADKLQFQRDGQRHLITPTDEENSQAARFGGQTIGNIALGAIGEEGPLLADKARTLLNSKMSSRSLNSLMEVNPKELEYGRNPGRRLASEGIPSLSKESMLNEVKKRKADAGLAIEAQLTRQGAGKTISDVDQLITNPLSDAVKGVGPGSESAFQNQLYERFKGILRVADDNRINLDQPLTPKQVNLIKKEVGAGMKWHGAPYEAEINQALEKVYQNLNNAVEQAVPGTKSLNKRWAELNSAENSLEYAVRGKGVDPLMPRSLSDVMNRTIGATPMTTGTTAVANRLLQFLSNKP